MKRKILPIIICMGVAFGIMACGKEEVTETLSTEEDSAAISTQPVEQLTEGVVEDNSSEPSLNDEYKKAYIDFLLKYAYENMGTPQQLKFDTALINDDGLPELLVFDGDSHSNGVSIYTYFYDKVVPVMDGIIDGYGSYGEVQYIMRKNLILSADSGMNQIHKKFYSFEGNNATLQCYLYSEFDMEAGKDVLWTIDDVNVTEEEYNAKYHEMEGEYEFTTKSYDSAKVMEEDLIYSTFDFNNTLKQEKSEDKVFLGTWLESYQRDSNGEIYMPEDELLKIKVESGDMGSYVFTFLEGNGDSYVETIVYGNGQGENKLVEQESSLVVYSDGEYKVSFILNEDGTMTYLSGDFSTILTKQEE